LLLLRTQGDNFSCKRVSLLLHFIVNKTVALNGENARIKAPQRTGSPKVLFLSPPLQTARGVRHHDFLLSPHLSFDIESACSKAPRAAGATQQEMTLTRIPRAEIWALKRVLTFSKGRDATAIFCVADEVQAAPTPYNGVFVWIFQEVLHDFLTLSKQSSLGKACVFRIRRPRENFCLGKIWRLKST